MRATTTSLRRRVGSDAEDVYQHSLLRAIEHVRAHREPEHPNAWFAHHERG